MALIVPTAEQREAIAFFRDVKISSSKDWFRLTSAAEYAGRILQLLECLGVFVASPAEYRAYEQALQLEEIRENGT